MHTTSEAVDHPAHYQGRGGIEAITVIEAVCGLAGHAPNAIKCILRHQAKGRPAEDLGEALWYVRRLLAARERLDRLPALSLDRLAGICDAFGLRGPPGDALCHLLDALWAPTEDRYRANLRNAAAALGRAIATLEAGR